MTCLSYETTPFGVADPEVLFRRTTWRAREREPVTRVWDGDPRGAQGAEPLVTSQVLKLKSFFNWNVQRRDKFVPYSALSVLSRPTPEVDYTV